LYVTCNRGSNQWAIWYLDVSQYGESPTVVVNGTALSLSVTVSGGTSSCVITNGAGGDYNNLHFRFIGGSMGVEIASSYGGAFIRV
jgi:hypothetical protein